MKILIADKFQKAYLPTLNSLGHEISLEPDLTAEDLPQKIAGYDALIVRSTKVTADTINASDALSLIIRAGAGVNTIDVQSAASKGIFVCNIPGKNSIAVAELAFGLLLSIDRRIPDCVMDLKNNVWNKKKYSKGDGIYGKTVGIIGAGDIGLEFAKRANAFGMNVYAYDPIAQQERPPKVRSFLEQQIFTFCDSLEEMLEVSDVVSIHVPSNPHTVGMVNKDFLSHMKDNAILLNTSRGNIVVDEDLIEAMNNKDLRVGLDVFNNECATSTGTFQTELSKHPNVYGTHHIGASTEQAQNAIAEEVINVLKNFEEGNVLHPVNMELNPVTDYSLIMRAYDEVGVLASVLYRLKEKGISIHQLETRVFSGEKAQQIILNLRQKPEEETLEEIRNMEHVIQANLKISVKKDEE